MTKLLCGLALLCAATAAPASDEWTPRPEDVEVIRSGSTIMYKYRDADGVMVVQGQPPPGFLNSRESQEEAPAEGEPVAVPADPATQRTPASVPATNATRVLALALAALCMVAGLILLLLKPVLRHLRESTLERVVRKSGFPAFQGVVIPHKPGRDITLEHVLCTPAGLLVLVAPEMSGVITGGPALPNWSCGSKTDRVQVPNPLLQLADSIDAVQTLAGSVPVFGRVVMTEKTSFPLQPPEAVQSLAAFRAGLPGFATNATAERELGGAWRVLMRYPRDADTRSGVRIGRGPLAWARQHRREAGGGVLLLLGVVLTGAALIFAA